MVLFQQRYVKSHREERKFPTTSEPKYRDFLTRWRDRYGISPFFSLNLLVFLPQNEILINPFRRKSSFNRCISLTIKTLRSVLFRNTHASDSHGYVADDCRRFNDILAAYQPARRIRFLGGKAARYFRY